MRKIINIAITDLRVFMADRGNLISLFIMPVVLALVLGAALGGGDGATTVPVDVIDHDNSPQSQALLDTLRQLNETLVMCPADNGENDRCVLNDLDAYEQGDALTIEQSHQRIEDGQTAALIVIPEGYGESLRTFDEIILEYYSQADFSTGDAVLQSVQNAVQQVNGSIIAARVGAGLAEAVNVEADSSEFAQTVYQQANDIWAQDPVQVRYVLTEQGEQSGENVGAGFSQSVPGMGTMFTLFTVLTGMGLLLREKKRWTLQRLAVMPVSPAQLLAGKILARFLTGLLTFGVLIVVGLAVGVEFGNNPLGVALIVIAYTLSVTALTFALAPLARTEMQVGSISNLLGLSLAALGGAWWPLEIVPDAMKVIGHISPVAWAMDGFNEIIYYGGGLGDVLVYVAVLLVIAAGLFGVGIMTFQVED